MRALEEYNLDVNGGMKGCMFHYEQEEHEFKQGEVLHNFNGTDYKVMERYSKNNLLMMNMASGQFLVAVGVQCYSRYPYAGEYTNIRPLSAPCFCWKIRNILKILCIKDYL